MRRKRVTVITEQRKKLPIKEEMISMRLTKNQLQRLDFYRQVLEKHMGLPVTRGWVVTRLIELGTPSFERFYEIQEIFEEKE